MTLDAKVGYFIIGCGSGGAYGPKAQELSEKAFATTPKGARPLYGASSLHADLVFGKPVLGEFDFWRAVRPVEKIYQLLRYEDPEERVTVHIARFDPAHIFVSSNETIWRKARNFVPISATPALHRIFDEYLPQYENEAESFSQRNYNAFQEAIVKAGLRPEDEPKLPGDNASNERKESYLQAEREFYRRVLPHIILPEPLLVRVEGIDDVLDRISITEQPPW